MGDHTEPGYLVSIDRCHPASATDSLAISPVYNQPVLMAVLIGPYWTRHVVSQSKVVYRIMLCDVLAPVMVVLKWRSRTGKLDRAVTSG